MAFKIVHFHQLHMYERKFVKTKRSRNKLYKDYKNAETLDAKMENIITNKLNQHNCIQIHEDETGKSETLEIINYDEDYIFARMGKMKDIYQFQFRF